MAPGARDCVTQPGNRWQRTSGICQAARSGPGPDSVRAETRPQTQQPPESSMVSLELPGIE
jgi:hypothetical protein